MSPSHGITGLSSRPWWQVTGFVFLGAVLISSVFLVAVYTWTTRTGRYQIQSDSRGDRLFRLDTATGEIKVLHWNQVIGMFEPQPAVASASEWAEYVKSVKQEIDERRAASEKALENLKQTEAEARKRLEPCLRTGKSLADCRWEELLRAEPPPRPQRER